MVKCSILQCVLLVIIIIIIIDSGVVATTDVVEACTGVNIAVMVGGFPRKEGMERKDVMSKNVSIYKAQASALEKHAAANCKVCNIADVIYSVRLLAITFSMNLFSLCRCLLWLTQQILMR